MTADHINPNALSYWFPKIEVAGLPVPKTIIVEMDEPTWWGMLNAMDGQPAPEGADPLAFHAKIAAAADQVGWPAFLRSDHTSHKHRWRDTCYLARREDVAQHVYEIAEFSEIASLGVDLSWRRWAVREMLPTIPHGICRAYGNMPICREFRFFVTDGKMDCYHPYWPEAALSDGDPMWFDGTSPLIDEFNAIRSVHVFDELHDLATRAGAAVGGSWSVDILETRNGWMVTDMAVAEDSFHWPGCPNANALSRHEPERRAPKKEAVNG